MILKINSLKYGVKEVLYDEEDYIPKGKTKRRKLPITASYCPFCGKEI